MASPAEDRSYSLNSAIRGHHIYKSTWAPVIGQILEVKAEDNNSHDRYAISTLLDDIIVGHVPREYSRIAWYFLLHGGNITCEVTGGRRLSAEPEKGLEVPCVYTFIGKPTMIKKLVKLFSK